MMHIAPLWLSVGIYRRASMCLKSFGEMISSLASRFFKCRWRQATYPEEGPIGYVITQHNATILFIVDSKLNALVDIECLIETKL